MNIAISNILTPGTAQLPLQIKGSLFTFSAPLSRSLDNSLRKEKGNSLIIKNYSFVSYQTQFLKLI